MALAIDASTPALASATTTSVTTASFTPPSGSLIVLLMGFNTPTAGTDTSVSSVTNTGTAITWSRRVRKNTNSASTGGAGTDGGAEIWTGVGNGGAITVTATNGVAGTSGHKTIQAVVLTGADTASLSNVAAASSTSGLPSVALAGCTAGSYVFAVASDWQQKGLGTAGSGQTIISELNTTGQISIHNWRTTSTLASSGSQTMNLTAPSAEQYNLVVLEVLASGGAGGDATVSAVTATATSDASVPTITADSSIASPVATVTASALTPTVTSDASVAGEVATATADAPAPAVTVDYAVAGEVATATADAPVPAITADAAVQAVVATATADAPAPTVDVSGSASVTPPVGVVNAAFPAPSVTGGATLTGAVATATAAALAPSVFVDALVSAVTATVTADALAPSFSTPDGTVFAVPATASALAYEPRVSAVALVGIFRTPSFRMHYLDKVEPLIVRIGIPTSYSILKKDGFYSQILTPTDAEVAAADVAYLGGRDYVLTPSEQNDLTAAGYGSYITIQEVTQ